MTTTSITNRTDLTNALKSVQKQREDWEASAFAASNDKLYAILSAAYDVCLACIANPDLTEGVNYLLGLRDLTFTKNTSLELKVVRLVFAEPQTQDKHKYRLLSYARVLNLAHEKGETAATLPHYIIDQGGIDEIRRGTSAKKEEADANKFAAVAKEAFTAADQFGIFDPFKLPPELKPANGCRYSLALIRDNHDGTGTIVKGLKSNTLVDKALEEAGKGFAKEYGKQAEKDLLTGAAKFQLTIRAKAANTLNSALGPVLTVKEPTVAAE